MYKNENRSARRIMLLASFFLFLMVLSTHADITDPVVNPVVVNGENGGDKNNFEEELKELRASEIVQHQMNLVSFFNDMNDENEWNINTPIATSCTFTTGYMVVESTATLQERWVITTYKIDLCASINPYTIEDACLEIRYKLTPGAGGSVGLRVSCSNQETGGNVQQLAIFDTGITWQEKTVTLSDSGYQSSKPFFLRLEHHLRAKNDKVEVDWVANLI